jgi:hypothetical protein
MSLRMLDFEGLPKFHEIIVYKRFWSEHDIVLQVGNDSSSNSTRLMSAVQWSYIPARN